MVNVYLVDACRTPVGRFRGVLSGVRPDDLAATALRALLDRNPAVPPEAIEDVVMGAANQAGEDNRNVGRMAVLLAGLPMSVSGTTVNRLCGSSLDAVRVAWRELAAGEGELAVAGGVESMSRAPFVLPKAEERLPRRQEIVDTSLGWRLVNPRFPAQWTISMGETAEVLAEEFGITREEQDAFALASHQKALAAQAAGGFDAELVPVETARVGGREAPRFSVGAPTSGGAGVQGTRREEGTVTVDEGPRADTTLEVLSKLEPVFKAGGSVTAGNSSSLNDGAAAVLLAAEPALERYGLEPLARLVASGVAGVEPHRMGIGPAPALSKAVERAGWKLDDLEVVELNEAFAAQSLAVLRQLGLEEERVNPKGGAIALGHPLGCSGARILTTLVHTLASRPAGTRGAATMCIGVGQGIACLVERV